MRYEFNGSGLTVQKKLCTYNQSKHLESPHQIMFLIYVAIWNVLIDCMCKVVLNRQPTTIKFIGYLVLGANFKIWESKSVWLCPYKQ